MCLSSLVNPRNESGISENGHGQNMERILEILKEISKLVISDNFKSFHELAFYVIVKEDYKVHRRKVNRKEQ